MKSKLLVTSLVVISLGFTSLAQTDTGSQDSAKTSVAPDATNQSTPLAAIRGTIDDVVRIAELHRGDEKQKIRRAELREAINPRFDFDEMAKRSLGAQWGQITPAEQVDFTEVFSELLARTYLSKVETVRTGQVTVDSERLDFPRAAVKTSVKHDGDTFPIEYRLMNVNGSWRVYDVIVENIGLVANYRNEFAGIIRKETFAGLLKKLHQKIS